MENPKKTSALAAGALAMFVAGAGADKLITPVPVISARVVKLRIEDDGRMSIALHVGHGSSVRGRDIVCSVDGKPSLDGSPLVDSAAAELCKGAAAFSGSVQKLATSLAGILTK